MANGLVAAHRKGVVHRDLELAKAVSPGERWILYGEEPSYESELMLLENFG
jgi:hypothetical protein